MMRTDLVGHCAPDCALAESPVRSEINTAAAALMIVVFTPYPPA